jgi:hypothetical protein
MPTCLPHNSHSPKESSCLSNGRLTKHILSLKHCLGAARIDNAKDLHTEPRDTRTQTIYPTEAGVFDHRKQR